MVTSNILSFHQVAYVYTNLNGSRMIFALASVGNASVVDVADSELPSKCKYYIW